MTHTASEGEVYFRTNAGSTETGYVRVMDIQVESNPDGEYPVGTIKAEQVLTGKTETLDLAEMEEQIEYNHTMQVDESVIENALGTVLDFAWNEYRKLRRVNGRHEIYHATSPGGTASSEVSLAGIELAMFALDSETLGEGGEQE